MILARRIAAMSRTVAMVAILGLCACHGGASLRAAPADLRFRQHNFGAYCFDVSECNVSYDGHYVVRNGIAGRSPALPDAETLGALGASYLAIPNFPGPVSVTWRSKDGSRHEADIDIAAIFRTQVVRHEADAGSIAPDAYIGDPDIVMVVADRTITISMKAFITLAGNAPGEPGPDARFDLVDVFSRTFAATRDARPTRKRPGVELTPRERADLATVRQAIGHMGITDVVDGPDSRKRLFIANFGGRGASTDVRATHIDAIVLQNELSVLRSTRRTMAAAYVRHASHFTKGSTGDRRVGSLLGEDPAAKMTLRYMGEAWRWRRENPDVRILRQAVAVDDGEGRDAADQMSIGLYDAEWSRTEMKAPAARNGSRLPR